MKTTPLLLAQLGADEDEQEKLRRARAVRTVDRAFLDHLMKAETTMAARLGGVLYWIATTVAALMAVVGVGFTLVIYAFGL